MKYKSIPAIPIEALPDHINLLRNLQDMHQALVRLPDTFPVLELGDIVPNYEVQVVDFVHRGKRILAREELEPKLWDQEIKIDVSVSGMAAHELVVRKKVLMETLEQMIDRWQVLVDKIESKE
jgi:hypothetical protein